MSRPAALVRCSCGLAWPNDRRGRDTANVHQEWLAGERHAITLPEDDE